MKFRVTGGEDGTLGIDVGNRRYETGDLVEMTANDAEWLIECGALVKEPEAEPELEPADDDEEDDVVEKDDDDQEVDL